MLELKNNIVYTSSQDDEQYAHVVAHVDGSVVALATERGESYRRKGKPNEDGVATGMLDMGEKGKLILDLVVDGVGGNHDGGAASRIVLKIFKLLCETVPDVIVHHQKPSLAFVQQLVYGSHHVFEHEELNIGRLSTLLLSIRHGDELVTAHLGDSTAFLFQRDGTFVAQTEDHMKTRYRNTSARLLSALNREFPAERIYRDVDYKCFSISKDFPHGLLMVLASDGVTNNTLSKWKEGKQIVSGSHPVISHLIREHRGDVKEVCQGIMDFARERMKDYLPFLGSELGAMPDNSSCIVHEIKPAQS